MRGGGRGRREACFWQTNNNNCDKASIKCNKRARKNVYFNYAFIFVCLFLVIGGSVVQWFGGLSGLGGGR